MVDLPPMERRLNQDLNRYTRGERLEVSPHGRTIRAALIVVGHAVLSMATPTFTSIIVFSASSVGDDGLGPSRRADESLSRVRGKR